MANFIFGLVLIGICQGITEGCDFYEKILPYRPYYVHSPGYPHSYLAGDSCRWTLVSPRRTRMHVSCEEFFIPHSIGCRMDKLEISRSGDLNMTDAHSYCGRRIVDVVSEENRLNLVFSTTFFSPGGYFFCNIRAKPDLPFMPRSFPPPNCNCGYRNTMRVVGGIETGVHEFPMMAGLLDMVRKDVFCGGTIISNRFILTAAHCLTMRDPKLVGILVGDHDLVLGNETISTKVYLIKRFFVHPNYEPVDFLNDIAVVESQVDIQFDINVGPACLPFSNVRNSFAGETVYALGWGAIDYHGPASRKLLAVPLDVLTLGQCKFSYGDTVSDYQVCTYGGDRDACQRDSGGPLLWEDPISKVVKVVGIISYGVECATNNPAVNTRVSKYLDWIEYITGEHYCRI